KILQYFNSISFFVFDIYQFIKNFSWLCRHFYVFLFFIFMVFGFFDILCGVFVLKMLGVDS
ncbi:hypothetical protein DF186_19195, partial [Enterococcus hirae]